MLRLISVFSFLWIIALAQGAIVHAQGTSPRVALVVGNGAYEFVPQLRNSVNDAKAVAHRLSALGFDVVTVFDARRAALNETIGIFLDKVGPDSEAVIYFAGHGVEMGGANHLLPTDIPVLRPGQERLLRAESINLSELLLDLEGRRARVSIVVLDACRDNPFGSPGTRSLGGTRGLARVDPPRGAFVMYSAGTGEQALDTLGPQDLDPNGVFTRRFLRLLDQEGIELRDMVRQLRNDVNRMATAINHRQMPSYYDQLMGDFYFRPRTNPVVVETCDSLVDPGQPIAGLDPSRLERAISLCRAARQREPSEQRWTRLLDIAQEQNVAIASLGAPTRGPGERYLALYPTGAYRADIQAKLDAQTPDVVVASRQQPSVGTVAAGAAVLAAGAAGAAAMLSTPGQNTPPLSPSPAAAAVAPVVPSVPPRVLATAIQTELARLGCAPGRANGEWRSQTQRAIDVANQTANLALDRRSPSQATLDQLKGLSGRACPLTCATGQRVQGGVCVAVPRAAPQTQQAAPRTEAPAARAGSRCFTVGGQRFCE